jgi:hypothetical protein
LGSKVCFKERFNILKYKYIKESYFLVNFLVKKFVLSIIIRIFTASVLAKPLNNAQIVRGVFCYKQMSMQFIVTSNKIAYANA